MKEKPVVKVQRTRLLNVPDGFFHDPSMQITEEDAFGLDVDLGEAVKAPVSSLPHAQVKL